MHPYAWNDHAACLEADLSKERLRRIRKLAAERRKPGASKPREMQLLGWGRAPHMLACLNRRKAWALQQMALGLKLEPLMAAHRCSVRKPAHKLSLHSFFARRLSLQSVVQWSF